MAFKGVLAIYRVHWGISSRTPWGSVTQPSYLLPPPATILGAFAKALNDLGELKTKEFVERKNKEKGSKILSGAIEIISKLGEKWWVTAAWLSPVVRTGILIRYFSGPYQAFMMRHQTLLESLYVSQLFGPYKIGYSVSPHGILAILLVSNSFDHSLINGALTIRRFGSKEGFVDPLAVYEVELKRVDKTEVTTPWMVPMDCISEINGGNFIIEKTLFPLNSVELECVYSTSPCENPNPMTFHREVLYPRYPGWVKVKIRENCKAYVIEIKKAISISQFSIPKSFVKSFTIMRWENG